MQIQLKQAEIEAALKGYIAQQGINLTNKTISYNFTAGRKDSGISVELVIEDAVAAPQGPVNRTAAVVSPAPVSAPQAEVTTEAVDVPAPPPTVSLFSQ